VTDCITNPSDIYYALAFAFVLVALVVAVMHDAT